MKMGILTSSFSLTAQCSQETLLRGVSGERWQEEARQRQTGGNKMGEGEVLRRASPAGSWEGMEPTGGSVSQEAEKAGQSLQVYGWNSNYNNSTTLSGP